jgi:hypothetical protein
MLRLMRPRARALASFVVLVALPAACTHTGNSLDGSLGPSAPSSPIVVPTSVSPGGGVYVYENAGLTATLVLHAGAGTLRIDNRTGRELSPPDFYLLDARDGRRVDGTVDGATTTPAGSTAEFDVTFSGVEVRNIGLAVLLIGRDNYGAFVPA